MTSAGKFTWSTYDTLPRFDFDGLEDRCPIAPGLFLELVHSQQALLLPGLPTAAQRRSFAIVTDCCRSAVLRHCEDRCSFRPGSVPFRRSHKPLRPTFSGQGRMS